MDRRNSRGHSNRQSLRNGKPDRDDIAIDPTHNIRGISPNIFNVDLVGQPGDQRSRALNGHAADGDILQHPFDLQIAANDGYTLAYLEFSMFPGFTPARRSAGDHIPIPVRTLGA